jgi:hypothetical protein
MRFILPLLVALLAPSAAIAQRPPPPLPTGTEAYADLADLALAAPIVLRGTVAKAARLSPRDAPDVAPGRVRMLMTVSVTGVIAAPVTLPATVSYLWDGPLDARGRPPKFKGQQLMLFLRQPPGRSDQFQLVGSNAQIPLTSTADATVRSILTEARDPSLRNLRIVRVGNAFHVPGSVPGEAESQIFLHSADGRPISLVVLSRPGEAKSWSVSLGDVIDESAKPAAPRTLLWYRLACALPAQLPATSTGHMTSAAEIDAARADYAFVMSALGPCGRTTR